MKEINNLPCRCFGTFPDHPKDCCNPMRDDYQIATDENGCEYLVKVGEHDQYAEIQSYSDAVNFDRILERIALGDTSMLRPVSDSNFFDTSVLPDSPFEVIKFKQENIERFNQLPEDVRKLFNNDVAVFYDSIVNRSIDSIMENYGKQVGSNQSDDTKNNGGDNK